LGDTQLANLVLRQLQDKYPAAYAEVLKKMCGLDLVCDALQRGNVAPEAVKALWDMAALLPDGEFREFLAKRHGFARHLLQGRPLPASAAAAHQRMTALETAATDAAPAAERAHLAHAEAGAPCTRRGGRTLHTQRRAPRVKEG
jgi:hypothetical protein